MLIYMYFNVLLVSIIRQLTSLVPSVVIHLVRRPQFEICLKVNGAEVGGGVQVKPMTRVVSSNSVVDTA